MNKAFLLTWLSFILILHTVAAQTLTLKEAIHTALENYGSIRAKTNYLHASESLVKESKAEYFPDLNIAAQQDYGTINGQYGPMYGFRGYGTASAGPIVESQNWNAAFGALYVANVNWDFFSFGQSKGRVKVAQSEMSLNANDLEQEKFQHEIRVSAAYLNLLAAQRIILSQKNNLQRAEALRQVVVTRAINGLNPGVDSSQANAEVSAARIALTKAVDYAQEQSNLLAQLMGVKAPIETFLLDSIFVSQIPKGLYDSTLTNQDDHPVLKYYKSRVELSDEKSKYFHTLNFPVLTFFGIFQGRGSGFDYTYGTQGLYNFSHGYLDGVNPTRANYLLGIGLSWNLTTPLRVQHQVAAQRYISKGLQDEYDLINQNVTNQLVLSNSKIRNAITNYVEAPTQVKAASDAYAQKKVMYQNGLTTIVDVTQALFVLNRAETDRDIAYSNVWQALLLKAAATGDFGLFFNEF